MLNVSKCRRGIKVLRERETERERRMRKVTLNALKSLQFVWEFEIVISWFAQTKSDLRPMRLSYVSRHT